MMAALAANSGKADERTILNQPKLTGNWWGARDTLAEHGVELNVNLTQFYQGVTEGGKDREFEYGGKLDTYVNFDGGKAGLWPGFSVTTHIETRYGEDVNGIDGMFSLANFNMAFPKGEAADTGITALKVTQRLCDHLLLMGGKINTLDDFRLNYTGGNGLERFMNSVVVANIINGRTIPYSTYGAGFTVFADGGPTFTFLVRDPDNHPTTTDLDRLFANGALLTGSLRLPVTPFGLPGEQVFGANWSSRHFTSLEPSEWESVPGQGLFYYNIALIPCHLTADLQVARPSTKDVDTTVLAGMRLRIAF
jgi:porin